MMGCRPSLCLLMSLPTGNHMLWHNNAVSVKPPAPLTLPGHQAALLLPMPARQPSSQPQNPFWVPEGPSLSPLPLNSFFPSFYLEKFKLFFPLQNPLQISPSSKRAPSHFAS